MEELLLPSGAGGGGGGGGGGEEDGDGDGRRRRLLAAAEDGGRAARGFCRRHGLLTLSVAAVLTGCTLGFMLRGTKLSTQAKIYFSFPGELLMRMLKMLILPLITSSLMSGLSSMESRACCRMGVLTVTYYLWTTFMAVVVGIVLVLIIKPGVGTTMESNRLGAGPVMTSADALLDLIRNMVPSNLIEATFQQYKTDLIPILKVAARTAPPSFLYAVPDEEEGDAPRGRTVLLELTPPPEVTYRTSPGSSQQMNVLGIVIFSATMGLLLGRMGERGSPLINVCQCINECVMKIINAAVWYFPFGIVFLVAGKILDMQDPSTLGLKLGWYGVTVLAGLFVHGLVLLPGFYFLLTRQNPFRYIRGLLQAMVIALATSSSSATLPITMKCLLENCRVDRQIARFVLPVGATINMDGTALYEAVAAIFIAQVNDYELDFGQLVTISITATAASIGAAGIPQAGLVTMVIVLTSVGLPPDDITLIVAIDWILDRFRTMINVLGDALAAGIIAHLCRKDFPLSGAAKVPSYGSAAPRRPDVPLTRLRGDEEEGAGPEEEEEEGAGPAGHGHAHTVYYNICQV
ncbi:excitatory amino acid transporter 5-like [Salarias fasciatus]|uniref:excitatory amino acid transporter 5-like n=1 Tax=Salarias fasciatus TaxID=181472 RepID=UPI0011768755|nr:excitatory amino acid transporter 5-like [Salarias fasciatus]